MIAYLEGKIISKGMNYIVLAVDHVGYRVFVTPPQYADSAVGQELAFFTHQHVREDALELYGFKAHEELELFELLLSISGIGPKSALGAMAIASPADIKESIARGDSDLLTKVSGIGKKTAERIVLELRDKISKLPVTQSSSNGANLGSSDELDALVALGYSAVQARDALRNIDPKIKDSGERIRQALIKMGRG